MFMHAFATTQTKIYISAKVPFFTHESSEPITDETHSQQKKKNFVNLKL